MDKALAIVQLAASRQDPEVKFSRRLGGKSLLEWVVRRVTDCQRLEQVVVVLSDSPRERALAACVPPDVPVYFAQHRDALGRCVETLHRFPSAAVVRVSADNPFVDPVLIDRLLITAAAHPQCDYISYCSRDGKPAILSPLGIFAEWCSAKALQRAHQKASSPPDRNQVTRFLYAHPEQFQIRLIPVPTELDREDVRLRVDSEEDWEHTQAIHEALGAEECDWRRIAGLLDHQPALRKQMAALNRAGAEC